MMEGRRGEHGRIAWFCAYTPLEILEAMGFSPVRVFGNPAGLEAADPYLHNAVCPYIRACLALALEDGTPRHAVFVNSCDGMRRLHDVWREIFPDAFVHLVDLPRNEGEEGKEALKEEYLLLIEGLQDFCGRPLDHGSLAEACREWEERRRLYRSSRGNLGGRGRVLLARAIQSSPEEGRENLRDCVSTAPRRGTPVFLTGNLLNPDGMISILERAGADIVGVDLCNADRAFSLAPPPAGDLDGILSGLASSYLERHPCARMTSFERRYRLLVEGYRESGARGVIYASLKFCDSYLYDYPRVRNRLKEEGIPVLRLESDYADGHAGQLLTRVEAFLEML